MSVLYPPFASNRFATRADAQQLTRDLFEPLRPAFSAGRARVTFDGDGANFGRTAAELEGFSRPLWGIAPLVAGGGRFDHLECFIEGLTNGSDPAHPEYWGEVGDYDQRAVEMAAIGHALAIAPQLFWEPLSGPAKDRLARWLGGVERVVVHDDNWHFFVVLVQLGLERVGVRVDSAVRKFHLDRIDSFYLGDGWYGDGPEGFADHYNGYALHCYGLLYARLNGEADPQRAEVYRDRAAKFARSFRYWFDDDGASIGFGRSMTYRFGMASLWAALAVDGLEVLPWSETRGLWARHVRWWLSQPITDGNGRLTVGYSGAKPLMAEQYNSANSPYWAMKSLLPLSLPAEHPFWMAKEDAVPADLAPTIAVPAAAFIAHRNEGHAVLLPGGPTVSSVRNAPDKYGKFAYSSHFGLCVESDRWLHQGYAGDNMLALSADGHHWRARETVRSGRVTGQRLETLWSSWDGCEVETTQFFLGDWEIRAHTITADRPFECIETGHALDGSIEGLPLPIVDDPMIVSGGAESRIRDFGGLRRPGARPVMPNTNIMFAQAIVPVLTGSIQAGTTTLITAVHARPAHAAQCAPLSSVAVNAALAEAGITHRQATTPGSGQRLSLVRS
jgi:hypothetical protein